jgi:nitrite reductase (NADH) large subunit
VYEQAAVLAKVIAREEAISYEPRLSATALKVAGVDVFAGGRTTAEPGDHEVVLRDDASFVYKKLVIRDGVVVGAALLGDVRTAPLIGAALSGGAVVSDRLKLLGVGLSEDSIPGEDLPDDAIVCGCNGVSKVAIVEAINRTDGCTTRACVAKCTRASSSCGSCGPVVEGLLQLAGRSATPAPAETVCTCVPLSKAKLRERVLAENLRSVSEVLKVASDGVGCHRCRPALSFYLDVWWCGEHREELPARHINDRVHANVQRDGTFSVVPRMRGGITSPAELRRIADVAERYGVGMVKLTGGQRVDLLGVKKADLPAIWADLGMPSGHAYTKAIRTVKSCVGTDWCRFGVGDSTSLAVAMEKMLEGLYCPHKVKLGVTGCPRNCAEVTVKDLGVMAITGGWEIYVAGAAGMSVRKGDLLCTVKTAEEALEETAIAIQYYREEANYLERLYHFVPRVGIEAFHAATVEAAAEQRQALADRFRRSKANAVDPWRTVPAREPWRFEEAVQAPVPA